MDLQNLIDGLIKRKKTPKELVSSVKTLLVSISSEPSPVEKEFKVSQQAISKMLLEIREILYSTQDGRKPEILELTKELFASDLLSMLVETIELLDFECRKDVERVFTNLLKQCNSNGKNATVEYIENNAKLLETLCSVYRKKNDVYLILGPILRECLKHESLLKIILQNDYVFDFFEYVTMDNFDLASDAFLSFKEILCSNNKANNNCASIVLDFLIEKYDIFVQKYNKLLFADYITKRLALKLLGDLMMDRSNKSFMTKYIGSEENLKLIMSLLIDKSKNIQYEAFNIFKLFAYNPGKPDTVKNILVMNKQKLLQYLQMFNKDDSQFQDDKEKVLKALKAL